MVAALGPVGNGMPVHPMHNSAHAAASVESRNFKGRPNYSLAKLELADQIRLNHILQAFHVSVLAMTLVAVRCQRGDRYNAMRPMVTET